MKSLRAIIKQRTVEPKLYLLINSSDTGYNVTFANVKHFIPFSEIEYMCVGYKRILKRILKTKPT